MFGVVVRGLGRGFGERVAERIRGRLERLGAVARRGGGVRVGGAADDGFNTFSSDEDFEASEESFAGNDDGDARS